jgi:hypothetical protein
MHWTRAQDFALVQEIGPQVFTLLKDTNCDYNQEAESMFNISGSGGIFHTSGKICCFTGKDRKGKFYLN